MMQWWIALQPALVGVVLAWAGRTKVIGPNVAAAARRTALSRLVGKDRVVGAYRALGCMELALALLLLLPPAHPVEAAAAVALSLGMLGYLGYAKVVAPESSCGCLGEKHSPVRGRSFARAAVLVAASGLSLLAGNWWVTSMLEYPLAAVAVLAAELALIVMLSPELDHRWLLPLRRFRVRISHPLANRSFEVPLDSTVQQLLKSDAYRSVVDLLSSDLVDTWDEGEWRILTYTARRTSGAEPVTAVFAVPLLRYEPAAVRVALVDEAQTQVEDQALV